MGRDDFELGFRGSMEIYIISRTIQDDWKGKERYLSNEA